MLICAYNPSHLPAEKCGWDPLTDGRKINMMKHYEYTYLTRQDMSEDDAKNLQDKIGSFVTGKGGAIVDAPKARKRRLAYAIKKQNAAYLNTILFSFDPQNLADLKKDIAGEVEIMRGLILAYDPKKMEKEVRRGRPAIAAAEASADAEPAKVPTETEPKPKEDSPAEEKPAKESGEDKKDAPAEPAPAKPKRRTKIKAELRDIEEKLDEILK